MGLSHENPLATGAGMTLVERLKKKAEQYRMEADKYRAAECFQLAEICDAKAVAFRLAIREVRKP